MPQKKYIFDTNVLIHDPQAIYRFQDNDIYIPIYVLEEIDGLKNDPGERGRSAREATRALDDLRIRGNLVQGVVIHEGDEQSGKLFVYTPKEMRELSVATENKTDHRILQSALDIQAQDDHKTILVTMDINLRVRAEAMNMQVAPYEFQSVDIANLGNEVVNLDVLPDELDEYYAKGGLIVSDDDLAINACVLLTCSTDPKKTALGRVKSIQGEKVICKLKVPNVVMGIKPRNMEQQFALDLLLDDDVKLVTLMGRAGSGKTILTLCAGLHQVLEEGKYTRMLVSRPVVPMGRDLGALPGDLNEKLAPYTQPIYDNLDYLMMSSGAKSKYKKSYDDLFDEGLIQVEPLTYIRGRSIPNQFMIVDEAQSLTPHEAKTIITRCGENTKIVFTGDVHQIDNPYVSASSNGLSVTAKKMRNKITGHLALQKGERSELATLAAEEM